MVNAWLGHDYVVHWDAEGATLSRPYLRPPSGGLISEKFSYPNPCPYP